MPLAHNVSPPLGGKTCTDRIAPIAGSGRKVTSVCQWPLSGGLSRRVSSTMISGTPGTPGAVGTRGRGGVDRMDVQAAKTGGQCTLRGRGNGLIFEYQHPVLEQCGEQGDALGVIHAVVQAQAVDPRT